MNLFTLGLATLAVGGSCALGVTAGSPSSQGEDGAATKEFGAVGWGRRLEPALDSAKDSKKPVMLLFQEVPG